MTTDLRILTRYAEHAGSNVGKVVATCLGRQATVRWDQALSSDANHRAAAIVLADRLTEALATPPQRIRVGAEVDSNDAGTRRTFDASWRPRLVLERRGQEDRTAVVRGPDVTVALTPPVGGDYWSYRVMLSPTQAVVGFPKFGTIGVGFAAEDDWNTNLPYSNRPEVIAAHIGHNKGDDSIDDADVLAAIGMVCWAARVDRDGFREPYVGEGVDGARRSAQIDREEADTLPAGDRRDEVLASAERWDQQADLEDAYLARSDKLRAMMDRIDAVRDEGDE